MLTEEQKQLNITKSKRNYVLNQRRQQYKKIIENCNNKDEIVEAFIQFFSNSKYKEKN